MPAFETRTDSPGRLQKYPKIHVNTGEESSGSGPDLSLITIAEPTRTERIADAGLCLKTKTVYCIYKKKSDKT
ncbi:hypothetical protein COH79_12210 [Neisseria meningitidis]|nr:hypothetical protein COH79_12210 [Neisseria meningitidis]